MGADVVLAFIYRLDSSNARKYKITERCCAAQAGHRDADDLDPFMR